MRSLTFQAIRVYMHTFAVVLRRKNVNRKRNVNISIPFLREYCEYMDIGTNGLKNKRMNANIKIILYVRLKICYCE